MPRSYWWRRRISGWPRWNSWWRWRWSRKQHWCFPTRPDEQYDKDGDGVGDNADDFPNNKFASNWSTVYSNWNFHSVANRAGVILLNEDGRRVTKRSCKSWLGTNRKAIQELEQQRLRWRDKTQLNWCLKIDYSKAVKALAVQLSLLALPFCGLSCFPTSTNSDFMLHSR